MKIFEYFKMLKEKNFEGREPQEKPRNDKAFIAIIVVYLLIIGISCAAGFFDINNLFSTEKTAVDLKINISDFVILGVILLGYVITVIRGRRK